jgi:hypothetical protein
VDISKQHLFKIRKTQLWADRKKGREEGRKELPRESDFTMLSSLSGGVLFASMLFGRE